MSQEAYKFGGNDAINYEEFLGPLIFEPSAIEFVNFLPVVSPQLILETSCGSGRLTRHLRQSFPSATEIVATDISADMLTIAHEKLSGLPITYEVADGQQLPFASNLFDLVLNQYGLMFFPDKQKGFDEAYRVLKPGGYFAFTTWDRTAEMPFFSIVIDKHLIPLFSGEDTSRFHQPFAMHDPRQLMQHLKQAGFRNNKVLLIEFYGNAASYRDIVRAMFLQHRLGREVATERPDMFDAVTNSIESSYRDFFGTQPFSFRLQAWIGIGQK